MGLAKKGVAVFLIMAFLCLPVTMAGAEKKPPFKVEKAALQLGGGVASGMLLGGAGLLLGATIGSRTEYPPMGVLLGMIAGFLGGYVIGSPLGVYGIGSIGEETASFWATMGGSLAGTVLAGAIVEVFLPRSPDGTFALILLAAPPLGSTLAFQCTRRYKETMNITVVEQEQGKSFIFPLLQVSF